MSTPSGPTSLDCWQRAESTADQTYSRQRPGGELIDYPADGHHYADAVTQLWVASRFPRRLPLDSEATCE
jgi:hypothetical protein